MSGIKETESLLEQLGLFGVSEVEAKIYLHLVNKPPKSILQIAQELKLPRTSVYDNAIKLAEKGLVQKIIKHKSQQLQAHPLSILQEYVDREKARVEDLENRLASLEENVSQATVSLPTEVRYFNGARGLKQMLRNVLQTEKELVVYAKLGKGEASGDLFTARQMRELSSRGVKVRVITNPSAETLKYLASAVARRQWDELGQIRLVDSRNLYISGDIVIYDNIFASVHRQQSEVVGVEIENAELAATQKSIFEQIWAMAEPLDEYLKQANQA